MGSNARDIEHFVNLLGYTPLEAIESATRLGGEIMMKSHELGQIKPGYLADILLVDGDPLRDVRVLQRKENFENPLNFNCGLLGNWPKPSGRMTSRKTPAIARPAILQAVTNGPTRKVGRLSPRNPRLTRRS
jgi:Amidohydrolase family